MMCSFGAFAQEEQPAQKEYQYPNYSFWSNWSIGANGGVTLPLKGSDPNPNYTYNPSWGATLYFSKELNHVWDLRLIGTGHQINNGIGKALSMSVGTTFSIFDAIKGYNPERAWRLYLLASAGMGMDISGFAVDHFGNFYYIATGGIGVSYRFAEDWTVALEGTACAPGDLGDPFGRKGYYIYTSLGLAYNLGVTATDKARIAQEAMLTQENFDALTQERDQVKGELEVAKKSERALQEKVAALEKNQVNAEKLAKSEEELKKFHPSLEIEDVQVIGENGEKLGKMSRNDALDLAEEKKLDLVLVSSNPENPVCKIMNYGKHKFEQSKREKESKKKQKTLELKEIRVTPNIEEHDFGFKSKNAKKFLTDGNKVKITEAMNDYIKEKLGKLDKYLENSDNVRANVLVKVKGHEQTVEITIPLKSFILRSEETKDDFYAAVDKTIDKLERQVRKNKTRMMSKQVKPVYDFDFSVIEETKEDKEESKIVKRKTVEVKPMNEEEAILQMELLGHQFYLYKDSETDKTVVLYKRNDGNYGVIEAE